MPNYIGVGQYTMCGDCGVDVRNTTRHDKFHKDTLDELDRLRRENLALALRVEKLENKSIAERLGVLAVLR